MMEILNIFKRKKKKKIEITYMTPADFYATYKYCPQCGRSDYTVTRNKVPYIEKTHFVDKKNRIKCNKCRYVGRRDTMISYEELNNILKGNKK